MTQGEGVGTPGWGQPQVLTFLSPDWGLREASEERETQSGFLNHEVVLARQRWSESAGREDGHGEMRRGLLARQRWSERAGREDRYGEAAQRTSGEWERIHGVGGRR